MILPLLAVLQVASAQDSVPVVTLADALQRAARLDPGYVAAAGQVNNAEWARRAALALFIVPAVTLGANQTHYWPKTFNLATFDPRSTSVAATIDARIDLFTGGQKLAGLAASGAALEGAHAGELQARLTTAMNTELDYYAVLTQQALERVAEDQLQRAQQQFAVAVARVTSGAAVQTDSLQLALELTRARVTLLQQQASLRSAQLQLGRRIGLEGPADAAPVPSDSAAPPLPFTAQDAFARALAQGPAWRIARANERVASAQLWERRGAYLPRATLAFTGGAFDTTFYPKLVRRSQLALTVTLPLWDNGQREILLSQARTTHEVAAAIRADLERAARLDVTSAYDAYETSRATFALERDAVLVARENNRVQETRYRAGATTILDLLDAQNRLVSAEADLVLAVYNTRLSRAGLEVMLGERIHFDQGPQ
ncbi:MAG TPA: TolC family protein [Gemmatimonadales bacterium]|nr:TolC family protein [Gemmatimonadales bacterium]